MLSKQKKENLIHATIENRVDSVKKMLKNQPSQDDLDKALEGAFATGNLSIAKIFIENGADIYKNLENSLFLASHNRKFEVVKFLIEKGIDVNSNNCLLAKMLSKTGTIEILEWLKEKGGNLFADNNTPLINSVICNRDDIFIYLLKERADASAQNNAPVRFAAINGNLEILKELIEEGAKIGGYSDEHASLKALWNFNENHISIIKYVLSLDIELEVKNDFLLNWVINYPNKNLQNAYSDPFKDTEELLLENGLSIKQFLPKRKWFQIF